MDETLHAYLSYVDEQYDVPRLRGRSVGRGLYVGTDTVDELYDRAVAAGGESLIRPEDTPWGSRRARVLDPGGHEWSFGSYRPGGGTPSGTGSGKQGERDRSATS
ncbi:hypothetical protein Cch01nite_43800 [Cellulomonas chitinilytica]|uniref:VOC domain-containing protein n=1 Tax=Cellulomonas chitinilytica TaxID=398759 RepID=A0A919P8R6_9CELL|nr:VOC family protein [Cellulomonas chitinilytica]GIG23656.1 hypothetical protein Cch01nite_43800 [Cellulomonas chitinilytica]